MKTENKTVAPISDKDLETWAKYFGTGQLPENGEKQIERLSKRLVNLGDMTAVANYLSEVTKNDTMQYLSVAVERLTILEYIVTDKLGVTTEEMKEYAEKYYKELEEAKKLMEESKDKEEE